MDRKIADEKTVGGKRREDAAATDSGEDGKDQRNHLQTNMSLFFLLDDSDSRLLFFALLQLRCAVLLLLDGSLLYVELLFLMA